MSTLLTNQGRGIEHSPTLLLSHASYWLVSSSIVNFHHSSCSFQPKFGVPNGVANVEVATSLSRKLSLAYEDVQADGGGPGITKLHEGP